MSVRWNLEGIENWEELCWLPVEGGGERINPATQRLVDLMLVIGIGKIKEDNWEETFKRIHIFEKIEGNGLFTYDAEAEKLVYRDVSAEDVFQHIGLSVNASPETNSSFRKRAMSWLDDQSADEINRFTRKMKELSNARN